MGKRGWDGGQSDPRRYRAQEAYVQDDAGLAESPQTERRFPANVWSQEPYVYEVPLHRNQANDPRVTIVGLAMWPAAAAFLAIARILVPLGISVARLYRIRGVRLFSDGRIQLVTGSGQRIDIAAAQLVRVEARELFGAGRLIFHWAGHKAAMGRPAQLADFLWRLEMLAPQLRIDPAVRAL